jgi:uncharacterized protein (DUF58 family)
MPTGRGWGVAAAMLAGYAGAATLGYPELAVLATGCLVALVLGRLWLGRRAPLQVRRDISPARVSKGEPALGVLTVRNPGRIRTRALRGADHCGGQPITVDIPGLGPRHSRTEWYPLPTGRRGVVPVGPLVVTLTDPLVLFRRVHSYGPAGSLLVRPRTVRLATLTADRRASIEDTPSPVAGGTATFHALRQYVPGDDLRRIHWRSTARTGALMVRQLDDASLPTTTIVLDDRAASYRDDDFELAVDVVASVALAGVRLGFPVTVATSADGLVAAGTGADPVLDRLALVQSGRSGPDLATAVRLTRSRGGYGGGSLVVVTGRVPPAELDGLVAASGSLDRTVLVRVGAGLPPGPARFAKSTVDITELDGLARCWARLAPS